jgi:flavorubredoxin
MATIEEKKQCVLDALASNSNETEFIKKISSVFSKEEMDYIINDYVIPEPKAVQ